jgi:uncharacterized membrane protein YgcG
MNRFLINTVLVLTLLLASSLGADERILNYRSDIQVFSDGKLTVTETIRVRAEGQNIRRGIFRDFPTQYRDRFGNHVRVTFQPISVRRNGENEAWHTEDRSNGVRIYAGSANRTLVHGIHEYELVFVTNRQLGYFDDHDELYFNVVGNGWYFPIDRVEATVTLPFGVAAADLKLDVYTGAYGLQDSDATIEAINDRTVRIRSTRSLQAREGLTIAVAWPKGLIREPGTAQKIYWFVSDNGAALVMFIGLLAALGWYLWAWNKVGRDPDKGVIIPRFKPPTGLSPAACRYVLSMAFNRDAFTAAIISLAVKGHLLVEEDDKDFSLKRQASGSSVKPTKGESGVLDELLPDPGSEIEMDNKNHAKFQSARQALKKELKKEYQGRLFNLNGGYMAPAALFSVAAAIVAIFFDSGPPLWIGYLVLTLAVHGTFIYLLRAPTLAGRLVMDEIEGFRMYLDTAEQDRLDQLRSPALTPEVFECFLPYAYALGVENNWCQRFAREIPEEVQRRSGYNPRWYHGESRGMRALNHLGDNFGSSFSSAISSASSPPGSSSGSGGGGSSGGGGGGGGGGGW